MKKGLVVIFPGTGYTCRERLLVQISERYRLWGYDIVCLDFSGIPFDQMETFEEAFELAKACILAQTGGLSFGAYGDLVFVSKSFGTVCAGWLAQLSGLSPRQLFLTPVPEAFSYIGRDTHIMGMAIGTKDRHMEFGQVVSFCEEHGAPCVVIPGVGHNLKGKEGEYSAETDAINARILTLCS
jgi:hypothetical protein